MFKKLTLLCMMFLCSFSIASAVIINDVDMISVLNTDLSMTETIIINISNNTNKEFSLTFPQDSINLTVDGNEIVGNTVSEEIACEQCIVNIKYSFPNMIFNDSDNFTFYRMINMPVDVAHLRYVIILPENHILLDNDENFISAMPYPGKIIDNRIFEWTYNYPEFPKEFGVRYLEKMTFNTSDISDDTSVTFISSTQYFSFVILIIVVAGLFIMMRNLSKRKNKRN